MAHITPDFKTKKAFLEAFLRGVKIEVYSPGIYPAKKDGIEYIEAPSNFHKWYARVRVQNGYVVEVLKS